MSSGNEVAPRMRSATLPLTQRARSGFTVWWAMSRLRPVMSGRPRLLSTGANRTVNISCRSTIWEARSKLVLTGLSSSGATFVATSIAISGALRHWLTTCRAKRSPLPLPRAHSRRRSKLYGYENKYKAGRCGLTTAGRARPLTGSRAYFFPSSSCRGPSSATSLRTKRGPDRAQLGNCRPCSAS